MDAWSILETLPIILPISNQQLTENGDIFAKYFQFKAFYVSFDTSYKEVFDFPYFVNKRDAMAL